MIHRFSLSTDLSPSLYPETDHFHLRVTNFSPPTSQRPPSDSYNRNQWFELDTQCSTSRLLTWMQTNFLLTLMSVILTPVGGPSQNIYAPRWSSQPPKENQSCLRNKAFNSILIKNELSARMRTRQSTNNTNYRALAKWRANRCRINCVPPRSQWNKSPGCWIPCLYNNKKKNWKHNTRTDLLDISYSTLF